MIEVTHSADEAKKPYWLNKTSERINPFQSYTHAKYWIFYKLSLILPYGLSQLYVRKVWATFLACVLMSYVVGWGCVGFPDYGKFK